MSLLNDLIAQKITGGGLPSGGTEGQVLTRGSNNDAEWTDAGTPTAAQTQAAVDDYLDRKGTVPLTDDVKQALLNCFSHVAWATDDGQSYVDDLEDALYPSASLESISAVFTQGSAVIYDTDSLDTLKQYLTVTALYSDTTTKTVTTYTLSGTLEAGTSTITASYGGKTATFNVAVTASPHPGFTEVSYITTDQALSTGDEAGSYIVLPCNADKTKKYLIETEIKWGTGSVVQVYTVGCMGFNAFGYFGMHIPTQKYAIDSTNTGTNIPANTSGFDVVECNIDATNGSTISVNGSTANSGRTSYTSGSPLSLFAVANADNTKHMFAAKMSMKYCKVYIENVLSFDLIAVKRDSDNVAGLYDLISNAFYPSEGLTPFTYTA